MGINTLVDCFYKHWGVLTQLSKKVIDLEKWKTVFSAMIASLNKLITVCKKWYLGFNERVFPKLFLG